MQVTPRQVTPRRRRGSGFTLIEVMAGLFALGLILAGSAALFLATSRTAASVSNATGVSLDAANAAQHVIENLREAQDFVPVDARRNPVPDGASGSGLYICFASAYKPVTVGRGGGATATLGAAAPAGAPGALNDTSSYAAMLYVYRSDGAGTPSEAGTCLSLPGGHPRPRRARRGAVQQGRGHEHTAQRPALPGAAQHHMFHGRHAPRPDEFRLHCRRHGQHDRRVRADPQPRQRAEDLHRAAAAALSPRGPLLPQKADIESKKCKHRKNEKCRCVRPPAVGGAGRPS